MIKQNMAFFIHIDDVFESIYNTIIWNIQKFLGKGPGWMIDSAIDIDENIDDKECFKWCLVRYLHPADHDPRRITKADKDFAKKLDFKYVNFLVKVRDIYKILKKNSVGISVISYENKEKYPICV